MSEEKPFASLDRFLAQFPQVVTALHEEAECARWELSQKVFADALRRSAEKRFGATNPNPGEIEAYLKSLHLEDLALACACSEGNENAWEYFIAHFRQDLRNAANAILTGSGQAGGGRAEELADSLYAELYGVRSNEAGKRKSLFEYFHGRSKLCTWLRAVLAQKHVDLLRTSGKTLSLEEEKESENFRDPAMQTEFPAPDPARELYQGRVARCLSTALAALTSRERMILACYYVDRLTLAEIGRMLREHESTISRHLEHTRRALRENVAQSLRLGGPARNGCPAEPALDDAQVKLAFEYAVEDWPFDLSQALSTSEQVAADPPE
ncbi:MAG TPA: sigma-70 family RNA polymerase sigma factor [Candidatus Saccharimonadales bacterium]|jgi:RNA polymerase sigma-70 factor|nr:sigma-70 family RNA polymerase sigma factor [Candidatus Saccharimonadales bacterium]